MPAKRKEGDEVFNIKISDSDSESNEVNEMPGGANVKLPEFWAKEPSLWFVTAEGQFESKGITAESTKRAHVTAALSVKVATRVKDVSKKLIAGDVHNEQLPAGVFTVGHASPA